MFSTRQLIQPAEMARFAAAYEAASQGVTICPDYLSRIRQVRVASFSQHPDIYLGGYTINDAPPHRYFVVPGETARDAALAQLNLDETHLVEIGAIWFSDYPSLFRVMHRILLFQAMLRDALATDKPYILGGSFVPPVQAIQRVVLPNLVYEQRVTVGNYTGNLQLYIGSRRGIWWRFVKAVVIDGLRRLGKMLTGAKRRSPRISPAMP
ncbi:hypothetical protein [uncultured Spirosoma sp.]|uniref:hypothetical protein n=1 Tax=uncultured Spirosoma sp. TaxID=278208 RepID=UPI00258D1BC0|nr:hypothetical protein [uncultured Spirosoma sp.]